MKTSKTDKENHEKAKDDKEKSEKITNDKENNAKVKKTMLVIHGCLLSLTIGRLGLTCLKKYTGLGF